MTFGTPTTPTYPFILSVDRLSLPVYLGAGDDERSEQQTVHVSLRLFYPAAPDATRDDAADYLCYDGLCQSLLKVAAKQPYSLIEYLGAELFRTVRHAAPAHAKVWLKLEKPLPVSLVGYVVQGAGVEFTDMGGSGI